MTSISTKLSAALLLIVFLSNPATAQMSDNRAVLPSVFDLLLSDSQTVNPPVDPPAGSIIPAARATISSGERLLIDTDEFAVPNSADSGNFRITCGYSHMAYDDPVVFPGQPGKSHLHTFFGNTGANSYSTYESLRDTGESSCAGGIVNRSSYWVPSLFNKSNSRAIAPDLGYVYYKSGNWGQVPAQIQDIPNGLRMIAGNGMALSDQSEFIMSWSCNQNTPDGGPGASIRSSQNIPVCAAGQQLLARVAFPQCWDGENLDSVNHKSHMAYPFDDDFADDESNYGASNGIGNCPTTHPVMLPIITINVTWTVPTGGSSVLGLASDKPANGQAPGQGLHADFFEAWDSEFRDEMT
jgi:hypothetical protein